MKSHINTHELLANTSALMIADILSLRPRKKGGSFFITCPNPSHGEHVHDNCVIRRDDCGYVCFACGDRGDVVRMVQQVTGADFVSALETIATTVGGIDKYVETPTEKPVVTYQELKMLGLKATVVVEEVDSMSPFKDDEHTVCLDEGKEWEDSPSYGHTVRHVCSFFDEEGWPYIVEEKCHEYIDRHIRLLKNPDITPMEKKAHLKDIEDAKNILKRVKKKIRQK